MNSSMETQVEELLRQSRAAPRGPTAIALAEEAVRLADSARDPQLGMLARGALIDAAGHGGRSDKMLVAFAWVLAQCDAGERKEPLFHESTWLWRYKWVGEHVAEFPHITRGQISALFDDMELRYARNGNSAKPVHKLRCNACIRMGRLEEARHWLRLWQDTPKDWKNDCAACEADALGQFQLALGDFAGAMQTFAPIVEHGRLRCAEVPHLTYSRTLLPLARDGQAERASQYHEQGYRRIRSNPDFIEPVGRHLEFIGLYGETAEGLRLIERHLVWLTHSGSPLEHLAFYVGMRRVLVAARARARGETRRLRLPRTHPLWRQDGEYRWDELIHWADVELDKLAGAFDARNGNDYCARRVKEARA